MADAVAVVHAQNGRSALRVHRGRIERRRRSVTARRAERRLVR
jgi:hypothetical protein